VSRQLTLALLFVVAVIPHLGVWNAEFSFDDFEFVKDNASVRSLETAVQGFDSTSALGRHCSIFPQQRNFAKVLR